MIEFPEASHNNVMTLAFATLLDNNHVELNTCTMEVKTFHVRRPFCWAPPTLRQRETCPLEGCE